MRLPKDILTETYIKPRLFLCETDKTRICQLEVTNLQGSFKFNSMSELSFEVSRVYNDVTTGETKINKFYDKIEALRLIYLEGFGYFELQGPELSSDGIKESKTCTAYSLEYILSQKYLEDFKINMGTVDSLEVLNQQGDKLIPITLYNAGRKDLSLLHLILEKIYGWSIGHVDPQLKTLSRQFEIDRQSVYDFLMNDVCERFNCYVVFDTINNKINIYAESPTAKFFGDGKTTLFEIKNPVFGNIETVSIDGYKTTGWAYGIADGVGKLVLESAPEKEQIIEVVGVDSTWETDVFVSFDNLSKEININYDADSIKTVLTVTYGDDHNIREVNLGLPYLTDISYYYTVDWMGQDLYDAYTAYMEKSNESQKTYSENAQKISEINGKIAYEENRLSLDYSIANSVNASTVGMYYTKHTDAGGNTYYQEVSLPGEYKEGVDYYSNSTTNLQDGDTGNVSKLYGALKRYFYAYCYKDLADRDKSMDDALNELDALADSFKFMIDKGYSIDKLKTNIKNQNTKENKANVIKDFLSKMWTEIGRTPLKTLYLATYKTIQETNSGWSSETNQNYGYYYTTIIFIDSINAAISNLDARIKGYEDDRKIYQDANSEISNGLLMSENFTEQQLIRLSAFLREDELHIDDIVETSLDDLSSSLKLKKDAMESGRIELKKLCQPQLQFSMSMANIYALTEFEPIIDQFQLGNIIKVALRPDYIKQSRLLQVDINFEDFSDFSCEFGELTSLRTQSDIHADLLSNAISAGKSVATNSSYWTRGSDTATSTDLKIQQGLLDATTQIKSIDGTQGVVIDKYGIHLQKVDPTTGEVDPKQGWLVNNMFLYSDDGFKTSRSAFGELTIEGNTYYGLIAEMMLAGYIEGSKIKGGTIQIGEYTDKDGNKKYSFEVDEAGNVTMGASNKLNGYVTSSEFSVTAEAVRSAVERIDGAEKNISEIKQTADGIESTVKNIQIGGTNLLYNSEPTDIISPWIGSNETTVSAVDQDGKKCIKVDPSTGTQSYGYGCQSVSINEKSTYTLSAKVYVEVERNIMLQFWYDNNGWQYLANKVFSCKTGWNDVVLTYNLTSDLDKIIVGFGGKKDDPAFYVYHPQLETGNMVTAWSPSPNEIITRMSSIEQKADQITLKVGYGEIISSINQTPETISINASKIKLEGLVTANNYFKVLTDGSVEATSGKIGGWIIKNNRIASGEDETKSVFYLASPNATSYGNWILAKNSAGTATFAVSKEGVLTATGADITGKITATEGSIGGWTLTKGKTQLTGSDYTSLTSGTIGAENSIHLYTAYPTTTGISIGGSTNQAAWRLTIGSSFGVNNQGHLYCNNATISGAITGGSININNRFKVDASGNVTLPAGTKISWSDVTGTSGVATTSYVDGKGYQTASQVTTITNNTIQTTDVTATNLKVQSANITGTITANALSIQDSSGNTLFNAGNNAVSMAGWTVGSTSLKKGDFGGSSSICLHSSGTSGKYDIGGRNGNNWAFTIDKTFGVTLGGGLYCTSGKIGGWGISSSYLSGTSGSYTVTIKPSECSAYNSSDSHDYATSWYNIVQAGKSWANSSSDLNVKNSISNIDNYDIMFDNLKPCRYKYNYGTSDRYHTGFIAQEVVSAIEIAGLTSQDFAGVIHLASADENGCEWMLRRDEFVALNTWQIQKLKQRVAELEKKLEALQ